MKLYELTEQFNQLKAEDIDPEILADTLESLEMDIQEKCKNVAAYFQNLDVDISAMKEAEARIKARRLTLEKASESLKDYLRHNMNECGISKIESPEFSVTLKKPSQVVEVFDMNLIREDFINVKEVKTVDKVALKAAINAGVEIKGARLIDGKQGLLIK